MYTHMETLMMGLFVYFVKVRKTGKDSYLGERRGSVDDRAKDTGT